MKILFTMNKFKFFMIFAVSLVLMISCGKKKENVQKTEKKRVESVKVMTLHPVVVSKQIEYSSTLESYENINAAPAIQASIDKIFVEVGSEVKKGDVLFEMDQTQLKTTKTSLDNLKSNYDRMVELRKENIVSQQDFDAVKAQYLSTKESYEMLEKNIVYKAPFSGVVTAKNYEDGELFSGAPVVRLEELNTLKVYIDIPESYFRLVKKGMKVNIKSDLYPDKLFPADIEMLDPTIDASTHSFSAKIKIPNSSRKLRPGMSVSTVIDLGKANAMLVPYASALKLTGSNVRYVYLDDNGKAKRVIVKLGRRFDDKIEIISDEIKEGDKVIVEGQAGLVDGVELSVVK